jgi:hypothetical protein
VVATAEERLQDKIDRLQLGVRAVTALEWLSLEETVTPHEPTPGPAAEQESPPSEEEAPPSPPINLNGRVIPRHITSWHEMGQPAGYSIREYLQAATEQCNRHFTPLQHATLQAALMAFQFDPPRPTEDTNLSESEDDLQEEDDC